VGGPQPLAGGLATFAIDTLAIGSHTVTAMYGGDATYLGSTSAVLTQTVGAPLRPTNTVVTSNRNPSTYRQNVTFTATVRPQTGGGIPGGTVQFNIDGVDVGGVLTLSGAGRAILATNALDAGSHNVIATYSGNSTYAGSSSAPLVQVVSLRATTTNLSLSSSTPRVGQSVTFDARVSPSAAPGSIEFMIDGSSYGSPVVVDVTGRASLTVATLPVGVHTITASYLGSPNYAASTSVERTLTVRQGNTRTTLTSSGNPASPGTTVVITATVSPTGAAAGSPGGTVQFYVDLVPVGAPVSLNPVGQAALSTSSLTAGVHVIQAVYSGDASFAGSSRLIGQRIR
jgi:hypothetical protein